MSYLLPFRRQDTAGVAIVILNWNGWKDTIECLESLQKITYPFFQVIVVDNGSTDGSIERIEAWARGEVTVESPFVAYDAASKPVQVEKYRRPSTETVGANRTVMDQPGPEAHPCSRRLVLIETGENLGFAAGNNVGIRYALREGFPYILLLNNDTVVAKDFLDCLVRRGEIEKEIGIIGPVIYHYYAPARVWFAGGKLALRHRIYFPGYRRAKCRDGPQKEDVDYVVGCALMARREVLEQVGLLREEYFFGMEDVEFCLQAWKAGFRCQVDRDARIWHKEGGSTQDPLRSPMRWYYVRRNAIHYWRSLQGNPVRLVLFFLILGFRGAWHVCRWLITGRFDLVVASWRALWDGLRGQMGRSSRY